MLAHDGTVAGKTYLSKESVRQMTTKQTGPLLGEKYGFGFNTTDGTVFTHSGAFKTRMTVDHGQIRVFLVQHAADWSSGNPDADFATEARRWFPVESTP
jgi:CubicO group peptidase (beta-lactamase class C family)